MQRLGRAFTLVELLVAIGIIAVLMAFVLPAMSRAREQANQVTCLSNLRQLGLAYIMYCQDNCGWFSRAAPYATSPAEESPQDFIWWQQTSSNLYVAPDRDVFNSPILQYLGIKEDAHPIDTVVDFNEQRQRVLRCPSDPLADHPVGIGEPDGNYYYSYAVNNLMQSLDPKIASDSFRLPINKKTGKPFVVAGKLGNVKNPSLKILLVEEPEATIEDGSFDPTDGSNLLSVRHDHTALFPPDSLTGYVQINGVWTVRNGNCRGNVSFCDGHADYVPRAHVDDPSYEVTHVLLSCDPFY